jgi:single-stranded-DNA-specific exonuclease
MMPLCRLLVDVLKHRGIADPDLFVAPSVWSDMPSPFLIEGMEQAVVHVLAAVQSKQRLAVFGDYDCDGVLSTAILQATLRKLGVQPVVYLPHRDEGYGFTNEAVHQFSKTGIDLVITIDNGINAAGPIYLASRLAIDVVVVDHHHIETRANAKAMWSNSFCAAALGLLFSWALLEVSGIAHEELMSFLGSLSRLAAIASIADCVPLVGAARTLTRIGLAELGQTRHAGLRKMLLMAGVRGKDVPTSEQIAFRVAPRINAAGRVGHPVEALRMLTATLPEDQIELALSLDQLNRDRRRREKEALEELLLMIPKDVPAGLVLYGPQWKKGIAGILASRVRERYGVPTFVLVQEPRSGLAAGSGRSVDGFSLIEALRACGSVLHRFGGHHQAAGVTLTVENIPAFREQFEEYLVQHPPQPVEDPVAEADLDLTMAGTAFYQQLRSLEPFGIGNPTPIFRLVDVSVRPASPGFVTVRQRNREIKARSSQPVNDSGTALVALNGTTASLVKLL